MIYPNNYEDKIGFDKIRSLLHKSCLSTLGQEKITECFFETDFDQLSIKLGQTKEFIEIIESSEDVPMGYMLDTRNQLALARIEGRWLDEDTLFDLKRSLQTVISLRSFFQKKDGDKECYEYLQKLSADVPIFPDLIKQIDRIITTNGEVKDNASQKLANLRKEKSHVIGNISKTMNSILRHAQHEGWIEKDVNPSIRDGRLVIPIAPMNKKRIKGIVYDESATGKTVFVEPVQIVEANNRIRELENEEKKEIIKILTLLANEIRPFIDEIIFSYSFLGEIDFLNSKAHLATDIEAIVPIVKDTQLIEWKSARHPLLYLSLKKQNKKIIPLDIDINKENRILLISGPNAGGKSVCLKTVGLLQYMLQCGIPVPVEESSVFGVFDKLFLDIGDEQSIEDDLSTYSSHLSNMKFFDKNANNKSLILIDEFGGGTEPQIGGAIAESLLKRFNEKSVLGVITTHYQNLKHFATETKGISNGAMLYDRHKMQPLYTLSIGNPGSSFAIEIAKKIGLHDEVITHATTIVGQDYVNMDKYLQDIVRDKKYWENKRFDIRKNEKQLDYKLNQYEESLENIEKERKKIIAEAKRQAENLLNEANAKIENTIRQIRESQAEKEVTQKLRQNLTAFRKDKIEKETIATPLQNKNKKLKRNNNKENNHTKPNLINDKIEIGDAVKVVGSGVIAEVIEIEKKNAIIAIGSMRSSVKLSSLEKTSKNQLKKESRANSQTSNIFSDEMREKKLNFKADIDLRGFRANEAIEAVKYFIDDATLASVSRVRILHGTGMGALRLSIRNFLNDHPSVKSYADEHIDFGGTGITVVDLK